MGVTMGILTVGLFDITSEKATLYKLQHLGQPFGQIDGGDFLFLDTTADSVTTIYSTLRCFSPLFLDYDNDGFLDYFCANGHPQDIIELLNDHETYTTRSTFS